MFVVSLHIQFESMNESYLLPDSAAACVCISLAVATWPGASKADKGASLCWILILSLSLSD